jgi:hypothetical protein
MYIMEYKDGILSFENRSFRGSEVRSRLLDCVTPPRCIASLRFDSFSLTRRSEECGFCTLAS